MTKHCKDCRDWVKKPRFKRVGFCINADNEITGGNARFPACPDFRPRIEEVERQIKAKQE